MRKLGLILAAAGAALAFAAPASAQFYPQPAYGYAPPAYGYVQPAYGYGYAPRPFGYNSRGIVQNLEMRIAGIRSQIRGLAVRGMLNPGKARALDVQAASLQRTVRASAWNGINPYERASLEQRVARLEQKVQYASMRVRRAPRYASYRW